MDHGQGVGVESITLVRPASAVSLGSATGPRTWRCPRCTLSNALPRRTCEACAFRLNRRAAPGQPRDQDFLRLLTRGACARGG